jgi:hypothetical protein
MTALVAVETVLLGVLAVLVAGLLRAHGAVLRRLHELDNGGTQPRQFTLTPVARPAPAAPALGPAHDLTGETLDGELVSIRVREVDNDSLLLFLSSSCASCESFWSDLGGSRVLHLPEGTRLLVVPQTEDDVAQLRLLAPDGVDVIRSSDAWRDYEVPGSPHVVYVDGPSGRVRGEGTGQSLRQVAELLARSTGDAGFLTGGPSRKPARDREQEEAIDRELLANGILPGDPRLYGGEAP